MGGHPRRKWSPNVKSLLYCLPQPSHFGRLGPLCRSWTFVSCLRESRRSICLPHMTHFSRIGPPCRPWASRSCLHRLEVEGPVSLDFRPQFGCEHITSKGEHISWRGNVCIPRGSLPFRVLGTGASKSMWQLPDFRSAAEPFQQTPAQQNLYPDLERLHVHFWVFSD
jgi:hypothetical protein